MCLVEKMNKVREWSLYEFMIMLLLKKKKKESNRIAMDKKFGGLMWKTSPTKFSLPKIFPTKEGFLLYFLPFHLFHSCFLPNQMNHIG